MKITRKYSLANVGRTYESLTIEIEGDSAIEIIQRIDEIYKDATTKMKNGVIA